MDQNDSATEWQCCSCGAPSGKYTPEAMNKEGLHPDQCSNWCHCIHTRCDNCIVMYPSYFQRPVEESDEEDVLGSLPESRGQYPESSGFKTPPKNSGRLDDGNNKRMDIESQLTRDDSSYFSSELLPSEAHYKKHSAFDGRSSGQPTIDNETSSDQRMTCYETSSDPPIHEGEPAAKPSSTVTTPPSSIDDKIWGLECAHNKFHSFSRLQITAFEEKTYHMGRASEKRRRIVEEFGAYYNERLSDEAVAGPDGCKSCANLEGELNKLRGSCGQCGGAVISLGSSRIPSSPSGNDGITWKKKNLDARDRGLYAVDRKPPVTQRRYSLR